MTVVRNIAERSYTSAQSPTPSFSVPAGVRRLRFTFSRVGWPSGKVADLTVFDPNGDSCGTVGYDGGNTLAKNGTATSAYEIQPQDGQGFLMSGTYTSAVTIYQTLTTAITIERF